MIVNTIHHTNRGLQAFFGIPRYLLQIFFSIMSIWLLSAGIAIASSKPQTPKPNPVPAPSYSIGNYTLVSVTPAGGKNYDFAYRADAKNKGKTALSSLGLTLTAACKTTFTAIDGELNFGPIAAGKTASSTDTFTIRKSGAAPWTTKKLNDGLKWQINTGGTSGLPQVSVPYVVGLSQAIATSAITSAGLVLGTVTQASSIMVAAGNVISQTPVSGTSVSNGSTVDLVISSGLPPVNVPNVVGQTQANAATALTTAGLVVGTSTTATSTTVAAGLVISQTPASGTSVSNGSTVDLVISSGLPPVNVPNVVGQTQANAATAITTAGLVVGTSTPATSTTVAAGLVISQTPVSGTSVSSGSTVDLVISSGLPPVNVPNVVGQTQANAATAITTAGLVVGTSTASTSTTVAAGLVISQNPASGASVSSGSTVDLVISSGLPPVNVPDVVGQTQANAATALTTAGLVVGTSTTATSTTVAAGLVISQTPASGTSVNSGSPIDLVVSSGPSNALLPKKPIIVGINLVSQTQIDAGTVEDTYTAELQNDRHDRTNVGAVIVSLPNGFKTIQGGINFGNVTSGLNVISIDTFTIRHDPQVTINFADLYWNIFSDSVPPDIFPKVGGIAMPGNASDLAINAYLDYEDAGRYQDSDISDDLNGNPILRTVLDVEINPTSTVADINLLLQSIGGKIVSMTEGVNLISILIPDPGTLAELDNVLAKVNTTPAVTNASPRNIPAKDELPGNASYTSSHNPMPISGLGAFFQEIDQLSHHIAIKAPAAWNARAALDFDSSCVPYLVVDDYFGLGLSTNGNIDGSSTTIFNPDKVDNTHTWEWDKDSKKWKPNSGHGYHVLGIIAGDFDDALTTDRQQVTGIFPQSPKGKKLSTLLLDYHKLGYANPTVQLGKTIRDINNGTLTGQSGTKPTCNNNKPRRIVINRSIGFQVASFTAATAEAKAWDSFLRGPLGNKTTEKTFFLASSAGNKGDIGEVARNNSGFNLLGLDDVPGTFGKLYNTAVVENRIATPSGDTYSPDKILHYSSSTSGNLSGIGSVFDTNDTMQLLNTSSLLRFSSTSEKCGPIDARLPAPGTFPNGDSYTLGIALQKGGIYSFIGPVEYSVLSTALQSQDNDVGCYVGTSMSSPQVAGLAAYLWALRPEWDSRTIFTLISGNTERTVRDDPAKTPLQDSPIIDAYATILSADIATAKMDQATYQKEAPARMAILDITDGSGVPEANPDGKFDNKDAELYVDKLFPLDAKDPTKLDPGPRAPDYSRYDLNGDGYTGGSDHTARFNLDMDYDTNGGSVYTDYEKNITDFGVLCHSVNSKLFSGDVAVFDTYLKNKSQTYNQTISCSSKINDTGITFCGTSDTTNGACPAAGYPGQDGESGRDVTLNDDTDGHAGFSYTKIDANGSALPKDAPTWSCVKDNVTGLIWQRDVPTTGGLDGLGHFTNFSPSYQSLPGFPQYGSYGSASDATRLVNTINGQGLCGATNWRLPTADELQSIVDYGRFNPAIDTAYFPNTPVTLFWSSSPVAGYADLAWYVDFGSGHVSYVSRNYGYAVRLVRAGQ